MSDDEAGLTAKQGGFVILAAGLLVGLFHLYAAVFFFGGETAHQIALIGLIIPIIAAVLCFMYFDWWRGLRI